MHIIALSPDDADDSRAMAKRYGIGFSLVADEDLAIARQYVGVDDNGFPRPGVVIVRRDGTIAVRQIAANKYDRIYARKLVALLDALSGAAAKRQVAVRGGYDALSRREIAVGLAGGATRANNDGTDTSAVGQFALVARQPLGRHLAAGAAIQLSRGQGTRAHLAAVMRARIPMWAALAAWYADLRVGAALDLDRADPPAADRVGVASGLAGGVQLAWFPGLAIYFELAIDRAWFGGAGGASDATRTTATLGGGVTLLF